MQADFDVLQHFLDVSRSPVFSIGVDFAVAFQENRRYGNPSEQKLTRVFFKRAEGLASKHLPQLELLEPQPTLGASLGSMERGHGKNVLK